MHEPFESDSLAAWFMTAVFSVWGGVAQYLNSLARCKRKFTWPGLVFSAVISGFTGLLLGFIINYYNDNPWLVLFGAGMGGGMGMKTLDILLWAIKQKLGYQDPPPPADDSPGRE